MQITQNMSGVGCALGRNVLAGSRSRLLWFAAQTCVKSLCCFRSATSSVPRSRCGFFMARHQTASRLLRIHDTDHGGGSSFERDDDSRVDDGSTDYMEVARSLGGLSNVGT